MSRKNTSVAELLEQANNMLRNDDFSQDVKQGICMLLEDALSNSNNYKGYSHNELDRSEDGTYEVTPGTNYSRCYIVHHKLKADYNDCYIKRFN